MPVDEEWCCEGWNPVACRAGLHKPCSSSESFNCGIPGCEECGSVAYTPRLVITEQI